MAVEDEDIPARLANPYRTSGRSPAVWGITLGRVGAVTAGVIAVVAPSDAPDAGAADVDDTTHMVVTAGEVLFGTSDDVHNEVAEMSMPAGYLFPSSQLPPPPVSDALEI
jgi:hypothetical protein